MANPRIAAHTPPVCSGCYAQYPGRTHIDFMSAIEGGLIDPENPRGGHVDWVVLCEECVRGAYNLLPHPEADRIAALEATIKRADEARTKADEYTAALEAALAARPAAQPAAPKAPRKGRYEPKGQS